MLNEKVRSSGDAENDKCVGAIRKSRISNKCPSADNSVASKGEWTKSHCPSSFTSSVSTTCTSTLSHSESHLSAMRESQTNQRESSRVLSESLSPPSSGPKSTTKRSTCPSSRQVEGLVKNVESLTREDSVRRDEAPDATAEAHLEETPDITAKLSDVCHSSRKSGSRSTEVQTPHDCETTGKSRGRKQTGSHSQETASLCDAKEGDKPRSLKARDGKKQSGSSGVGASLPLPQKRPTLKGSTVSTAEKTAMGKHLNSNAGLLFVPQIPPLPKALQHISLICTGDRENAELRALTQIQQSVMEHVTSQAMTQSAVVRLRIQRQLRTAGVSAADLENVEEYLVHKMPLTIAVDLLNVVPHLLEDNSYRNRFELKSQAQLAEVSERRSWEGQLFNGIYDHSSVRPEHRPKRGLLNLYLYPYADSRFHPSGQAFLLLEEHVRVRVTVAASQDIRGNRRHRVGTLPDMWHVLELLGKEQLQTVLDLANGRRKRPVFFDENKRAEFHVHGALDLTKDVAAIAVRKSEYEAKGRTRDYLDQISQKYLFPIITCEELDELLEQGRGWYTAVRERGHVVIQRSAAMQNTSGFI
ncbi:hypothetical protein TGPRC2_218215 [Toxoplasma gondii TgCatPRC2]|uniref:Uncharacterized protein n=1 Tax=Toxoplasma gondii TgCatPRC2 TaxID=1130821 RepID=A0A151HCK2_TOXGO|nr:hypothetical protein TGPRC2_218215 [Toxoplasma gondii TgCatPRC2]